ncbi:MAG: prephenate dehydrogenase/arogenate dehydrogenase family protein [Candidatus Caenarcaniphilales bacterium]|jgi:prephenate dehydrogenase|nr:prephenate dehydrogenase/arogenate dehydrogenase family protein [Candidatus Caenarcaniphilales bacterium]
MQEKLKIGIIGLGLIGGSIEKCLQQSPEQFEIFSVSESQKRPYKIENLIECDVVFLCAEQSKLALQLDKIAQIISRSGQEGHISEEQRAFAKTIITDVASTKHLFCQKATDLGLKNFIGGHPMAGTEHKGFEASDASMFKEATWILTDRNAVLEEIITKYLGAKVLIMDSETHDKSVAVVSHLPLLLSLGLADMAINMPQVAKVIGPGFKGMTRLAKGNPELGREIISLNRSNIKDAWDLFKTEIETLLEIKGPSLEEELKLIKEKILCL